MSDPVFLDENGIRITKSALEAKGQIFEFAKIISVRLERKRPFGPFGPAKFGLVVDAGNGWQVVHETTDEAFISRVLKAMDAAAKEERVK